MRYTASRLRYGVGLAVIVFTSLSNCQCQNENAKARAKTPLSDFQFDMELYERVMRNMTREAHPLGSSRQKQVAKDLRQEAENLGLQAMLQAFTATTPNPAANDAGGPQALTIDLEGNNIIASYTGLSKACYFVFGSHYDTKIIAGGQYVGANDSGSSSVALLQIASYLKSNTQVLNQLRCEPLFIWFDGEESVLEGWSDGKNIHPAKIQDNTYGSRYFVENLSKCEQGWCFGGFSSNRRVDSLILLDLVGMADLKFSNDRYSNENYKDIFVNILRRNKLDDLWANPPKYIEDDHVPFVSQGIPAINLIDFENLTHWHRHTDLPENVSPASIGTASRLAIELALSI